MRKVVAHGERAAFGPVRGRQDGRDGGVVRGVPVHGVGELGLPLPGAWAELGGSLYVLKPAISRASWFVSVGPGA